MKNHIYFKGLNGLRAIAALSVVISHIGLSLNEFNLRVLPTIDLAGFGVTIFFALSGFLITYLLLNEQKNGTIHIKHFYIRRILRIWPLYFFILFATILTLYIYTPQGINNSLPYYFILMANVPFIINTSLPLLGHYWSLGVEEQFYLFWPWLIKKSKKTLFVVLLFTFGFFCIRLFSRFIEYKYGYSLLYQIVHVTRFDCMSIGAIGAILYFNTHKVFMKIATHTLTQFISWGVILLLACNKFHIASVIDQEIVAIITVFLILNVSTNPKSLINLENSLFNFIGKISYGIYVIHPIIIFYFSKIINSVQMNPQFKYPIIYIGVLSVTVFFAFLSYEYLEKYFLKLKKNYNHTK